MGWLSAILRKPDRKLAYAQMLNGFTPIFSQFGDDIYASDVVQQAITCIVDEVRKLQPVHERLVGEDIIPVNDDVQWTLNNPNPLMTKSDFLEKFMWSLFLHYNAFAIPVYDVWTDDLGNERRNYRAIYPVQPNFVEIGEDLTGQLYITMKFANHHETTLPYSDVIHIKYRYSMNEFLGGNAQGQPDHGPLLKTLQLNEDLMTGVSKAMRSSFAINGVVKYNSIMDNANTLEAINELEKKLLANQSGFLPLDLKAEYIPLDRKIKLVDAETIRFIDEKILRNFVPLCILTGDYTKAQYEAFYQKTIEPLVISLSDEFTRVFFSERRRRLGNRVRFYPKDLIFMSTDQTIEMVRLLGDSGGLYENEKRVAFGMRPLPELAGRRMQSLNYVDVEYAREYQTNGGGNGGKSEEDADEGGQAGAD